ncbi:MAG: ATP-binding cassette domain-containing protein [Actinomycetota bacterium]|nr:ATP-binding cassette domain-containing protein [Actinomycetota bacterium]
MRAVDDLSFEVSRGRVTGFLGPNGAGKTTTIRMILGLARPTSGEAQVDGRSYAELPDPAQMVGALIDGADAHPMRSGRDHLRILAAERGVDRAGVDEALETVGLSDSAGRRVGEFSLGMRQRLGLAGALLANPELLILDEPANGLDPVGIRWLRSFLRDWADGGRSVFVSSHQLAEISQLADEVIVLNRGRFVTQKPVAALTSGHGASVRSPDAERLGQALKEAASSIRLEGDRLLVEGLSSAEIGEAAARERLVLHELTPTMQSLEDVFLALTAGDEDK